MSEVFLLLGLLVAGQVECGFELQSIQAPLLLDSGFVWMSSDWTPEMFWVVT